MKHLMTALAMTFLVVSLPASAQPAQEASGGASKPPSAQQQKMVACQADATRSGKKGTERQEMVNNCLRARPVAAAKPLTSQQSKMVTCQAAATKSGKTGPERQAMVNECLKNPS